MTNFAQRSGIHPPQQTPKDSLNGEDAGLHAQFIAGTKNGLVTLSPEPQVELLGYDITALASGSNTVWAITDRNAIWQRDLEHQWHQVTTVSEGELHCLFPFAESLLVGTSSACLLRVQEGDLKRINCFESIEEREEWYTPWGDPPDVRSLAISPSGILYVNVHVGGILRSDDGGATWQPTIDFHADVHEVCTVPGRPDWVLAATAQGLAISKEKGETWCFDSENLHGAYARAVAVCGEIVLMSASTGPHTDRAALYHRPLDQPGGFKKCQQGLPEWFPSNINTGTLATAGSCAVFGTREGKIFRSTDAGQSWKSIATGLAPIQCLVMA
ncbi:WD40/YVTN/BNR-like repeat-containing protein [Lyngbya confervoides]|uniref:Glycosyl hydrolase n=1 Tax=Lyngbya confervoides BDU141951 TaxID=1574623 RepID=A0ABD4T8X4_9CYAN|nr:hypothetical protein [Lyngbya confervoides]MCM1985247.1 hypothetical protein [Lyngbya confervoides BDU141951]